MAIGSLGGAQVVVFRLVFRFNNGIVSELEFIDSRSLTTCCLALSSCPPNRHLISWRHQLRGAQHAGPAQQVALLFANKSLAARLDANPPSEPMASSGAQLGGHASDRLLLSCRRLLLSLAAVQFKFIFARKRSHHLAPNIHPADHPNTKGAPRPWHAGASRNLLPAGRPDLLRAGEHPAAGPTSWGAV